MHGGKKYAFRKWAFYCWADKIFWQRKFEIVRRLKTLEKIIKEAQNVISDKDKSDYFEELWEHYQGKEFLGVFTERMDSFVELYS